MRGSAWFQVVLGSVGNQYHAVVRLIFKAKRMSVVIPPLDLLSSAVPTSLKTAAFPSFEKWGQSTGSV